MPTAPLHIGHIAALLPGDILARYHRAIGDRVFYVSGSDCHGTPVVLRARQEISTPQEISDRYHREFVEVFSKLGFSYDRYGQTSSNEHKQFVRTFHEKLYKSPHIIEKTEPKAYCLHCEQFLIDRYVAGLCPHCGKAARGDQCESCGSMLEPEQLNQPFCTLCGSTPEFHETTHLFISLKQLEKSLRELLDKHPEWRRNAQALTHRYIEEGLQDRALTRELTWGIDVPHPDYPGKKIYIWAENVLGYLSMSATVANQHEIPLAALWGLGTDHRAKHYYVHGKDNIPFHTIILPALLLANGQGWHLPDSIISSEYLTLEGRKISTSQNWAIWAADLLKRYQPDSLRYFLIANGPEKRDTDFTWHEFISSHNSELLGAYGNFVQRTLAFIWRYQDAMIPDGILEDDLRRELENLYGSVGSKIEAGHFKEALDELFSRIRAANRFYDAEKPWLTRTGDPEHCKQTLFSCVQIIANLAVLLQPFLPFSFNQLCKSLDISTAWHWHKVPTGKSIPEPQLLFKRIDKKAEQLELERLQKNQAAGSC